jgi:phospholipid/cholesterol/gamma-HCH transport system ATP-binding protein
MAAPEVLIRVEDLSVAYGDELVLHQVSFEVRRGEVFAILGGSGSGKSSLLRQMIGLERPASGRILYGDRDLAAATGRQRQALLRRFGVAYQGGALFGSRTLRENVRLPLEEFTDLPDEALDAVADAKLRMVQLEGFEEHLPAEVSGGMQKRAALARALALDPEVVFLDEPSAGLGLTFVVVTHELASIEAIADRLIMLDRARRGIVAQGSLEEVRRSPEPFVQDFFQRRAARRAAAPGGAS